VMKELVVVESTAMSSTGKPIILLQKRFMYICEFKFSMNLNLKYLNIDVICIFQMMSVGLS
jgi:hypothetical protein